MVQYSGVKQNLWEKSKAEHRGKFKKHIRKEYKYIINYLSISLTKR